MPNHDLHLTLRPRGTRHPHGGRCSCGWTTTGYPSAGMVHSAHNVHLAAVEADELRRAAEIELARDAVSPAVRFLIG